MPPEILCYDRATGRSVSAIRDLIFRSRGEALTGQGREQP
jgi:hypothetical protein